MNSGRFSGDHAPVRLPAGGGFQRGGEEGDLFRGTAKYYAAYRRPYPPDVVKYLVNTLRLDGRGRLLDGGCGTGQVFSGLARYFEATFAFDPDAEMVELARKTATDANVQVARMKAEDLRPDMGPFRTAVFAASFHWMDRTRVAELVYEMLEPLGHIVILAPEPLHSGDWPLDTTIRETVAQWLGPHRRAGDGVYVPGERHGDALAKTRFGRPTTVDIDVEEMWSVDEIIGWLYSTSFANRALLGDGADAFEATLSNKLLALAPDGRIKRTTEYTVIWAARSDDHR